MPFCSKCGKQLQATAKFCPGCGTPVKTTAAVPVAPAPTALQGVKRVNGKLQLTPYQGVAREFPLAGQVLQISPALDTFNHYRKVYHALAKQASAALQRDYTARIRNLDAFLSTFFPMYLHYRAPLIEAAVDVFPQVGIFDISASQFEESHNNDFCLCAEDVQIMIDSFNKTIEANQDRKIRAYNMMPGMIFSGLGGLVAATAVNVAMQNIAEADIRNANVSPAQRTELFNRIDTAILMDRAFTDYWRVFLTLTWELRRRGEDIWYPTDDTNQRGEGLFQNLQAGRVPTNRVPEALVTLLQISPYAEGHLDCVVARCGRTSQVEAICNYFNCN